MGAYKYGDKPAFDALFRSLAPRVRSFFLRRFGDPAVADDLLQTTFMKVHRARANYRDGAPIRPWIFTIAARVGLDERRRRVRRPEDADEARLEKATHAVALEKSTVLDAIERAELGKRVREALDLLPESQRAVIRLHRYEGLTFDEIGKVLHSTEGAVKLRAFRAYERLRKHLAPVMREMKGGSSQDVRFEGVDPSN